MDIFTKNTSACACHLALSGISGQCSFVNHQKLNHNDLNARGLLFMFVSRPPDLTVMCHTATYAEMPFLFWNRWPPPPQIPPTSPPPPSHRTGMINVEFLLQPQHDSISNSYCTISTTTWITQWAAAPCPHFPPQERTAIRVGALWHCDNASVIHVGCWQTHTWNLCHIRYLRCFFFYSVPNAFISLWLCSQCVAFSNNTFFLKKKNGGVEISQCFCIKQISKATLVWIFKI